MNDPSAAEQKPGDFRQRVHVIAGKEILFGNEGFLWHVEDWAEEIAEILALESGIGGLVLNRQVENIETLRFGGTGIDSGSLVHTQDFPYRLEAGILNLPGIIGLSESLDFLEEVGAGSIHAREMELLERFRDGLSVLTGVELYCVQTLSNHIGLLTANVRGLDPSDAGAILDADFNIPPLFTGASVLLPMAASASVSDL